MSWRGWTEIVGETGETGRGRRARLAATRNREALADDWLRAWAGWAATA
jgi:hypothetical protein